MSELLDSTIKKVTVHDGLSNLQDRIRHVFIDGLMVMIVAALIRTVVEHMFIFHSRGWYDFIIISYNWVFIFCTIQ